MTYCDARDRWVEQLVIVAAFGASIVVIGSAVAVAVLRQTGRPNRVVQSRSDALEVRSSVLLYMGQEAGAKCPTLNQLRVAGVLDSSRRTTDAWDHPFVVECD